MSLGPWQLAIIAILILVLFGRGKISEMMGDFGKGIKSFKQGMNEEQKTEAQNASKPSGHIEGPAADPEPASDAQTSKSSDTTQ